MNKKEVKKKSTQKKIANKSKTKNQNNSVKSYPKKISNATHKKNEIKIEESVKEKKYIFYQLLVFCIFITIFSFVNYFVYPPIPYIQDVFLDKDNYVNVIFKINKFKLNNDIYCSYSENDDELKWIKLEDNYCKYKMDKNTYKTYLKNEDGTILMIDTSKIGKVLSLKANTNMIFLPINGKEKIELKYDKIGYVEEKYNYYSLNNKIASFDNGVIKGISKGKTTVYAELLNEKVSIDVVVTNLITSRPKTFDLSKPYLSCNKYSKEDNLLLDEILKEKIKNVGYKTRAGVVEAARFLTLDFPYRINYFYENGRQTTNNVDGEGRYYHTGLYLSSVKYKEITGKSKGPVIWGCSLYSRPDHKKSPNGLDCSGFVSWALLNGGFDVKDVGAGWSDRLDLTDYGDVKRINLSLIKSNKIKVGDLLHSNRLGGHIGIIVGIDDKNYYIAQAIWYKPIGVVITKIKKEKLSSLFPHVVLMDNYYKKDGNLTNMW